GGVVRRKLATPVGIDAGQRVPLLAHPAQNRRRCGVEISLTVAKAVRADPAAAYSDVLAAADNALRLRRLRENKNRSQRRADERSLRQRSHLHEDRLASHHCAAPRSARPFLTPWSDGSSSSALRKSAIAASRRPEPL